MALSFNLDMFTLPPLPYDYKSLEPYIDELTMHIHHDKHHQAYVDNLNKSLEGNPGLTDKTIEDILTNLNAVPEDIRTKVRNNGGGHYNHSLFWTMMTPGGGGEPGRELSQAIISTFGDFALFKEKFSAAGAGRFGSGWAWLVLDSGQLTIISTANQDSPISDNKKIVLGLDVWEHAYYLKYQNKRADYITAWWNTVNWKEAESRFLSLK